MKGMAKKTSFILTAGLLGLMIPRLSLATLIVADTADAGVRYVESTGIFGIVDAGSDNAHIGNRATSSQLRVIVIPFALPALGPDQFFDPNESIFSIRLLGRDLGTAFGVDLYGLRYASTSTVSTNDFAPSGAVLLQETLFDSSASNGTRISTDATGNANLSAWLETQYDAGAQAGDFVFLQLRADSSVVTDAFNSYQIGMANNADSAARPNLEVSIIPEPGTLGLFGISMLALWVYKRRTRG